MINKINIISIINAVSKYLYFFAIGASVIIISVLIYIMFGGSIDGSIDLSSMINEKNNTLQYTNFDQVPFVIKSLFLLIATLIIAPTLIVLKFWKNFISLINLGKYFEIDTIKNLKYISYILFMIWFLGFALHDILNPTISTFISSQIDFTKDGLSLNIYNKEEGFTLPSVFFLFNAAIFWILAHILIEGIKIKEENELTV
ncbi:MAG: DUF2975 domain-containing protein [Pseudomonadota bacterium]|nr:DUF2975 domain-containing protein [Pseudomonadota bacterium]